MRGRSVAAAVCLVTFFGAGALAQTTQWPERAGDSTVVPRMLARSRTLAYEGDGRTIDFDSPDNLIGIEGGSATRVVLARFAPNHPATGSPPSVVRIVAQTHTPAGLYFVEFYFDHDSLFFMVDGLVFAAGHAPNGSWRNFRNEPAWERRVYWGNGLVAFVETSGRSAQLSSADAVTLVERAQRMRRLMVQRVTR